MPTGEVRRWMFSDIEQTRQVRPRGDGQRSYGYFFDSSAVTSQSTHHVLLYAHPFIFSARLPIILPIISYSTWQTLPAKSSLGTPPPLHLPLSSSSFVRLILQSLSKTSRSTLNMVSSTIHSGSAVLPVQSRLVAPSLSEWLQSDYRLSTMLCMLTT